MTDSSQEEIAASIKEVEVRNLMAADEAGIELL